MKLKQDLPMDAASKGQQPQNRTPPGGLSRNSARRPQDTVTIGLQKMFAAIADEPIPDDFLQLLDKIEASTCVQHSNGDDR